MDGMDGWMEQIDRCEEVNRGNRWTDMNRWTENRWTDVKRWINRTDGQMEQVDRWDRWTEGTDGQMEWVDRHEQIDRHK